MRWFKDFPLILVEGFSVGPLSEQESRALFDLYSDNRVCMFLQREPMRQEKEAEALIRKWQEDFRHRRGIRWGIYKDAGEEKALMGTVAIHYVDSINRRAELGADLFPCYWGAGIISRLVERLKEAAFKELGLHRLEIRCMPDNIASVRIALKAGFTFEGTLRDYVYIPGKGFTDESVYRLLAPEYFSGSPASEE